MSKPRAKPSDPSEILERRRMQKEDAEYFAIRAQIDPSVMVRQDHRGVIVHAKRQTVFELLESRKSIYHGQLRAIERLQKDMAIGAHQADRGRPVARVDGGGPCGPEDYIQAAQDRCALVASHMLPGFWVALRDLIENENDGAPQEWRKVVRMASGEEQESCQVMVIRWASQNLVEAYKAIDNSAPVGRQRARLAGGV